jgi:hypothetical protein
VAAEQVAHEFANEETLFRLKRQALKDGMRMLTRYLAGYPGRKHMIWFTGQTADAPARTLAIVLINHQTTVSGPRFGARRRN